MTSTVSERVHKYRNGLRASGLRLIQIWVPDTRRPGFAETCRRQSLLAAEADRRDAELMAFMDVSLSDIADDAS
jgi:hypothetical protein